MSSAAAIAETRKINARAHVISCNNPQSENDKSDSVGANVSMLVDKSPQQIEQEPLNQSTEEANSLSDYGDGVVEDEDVASLSKSPDTNLQDTQILSTNSTCSLHAFSSWMSQTDLARNGIPARSGSESEEHLTAFFDPKALEKQENENGMNQFYSMQLRDANKMVESLQDKLN
ncbi:hypothetical protein VP01_1981g11 [Puccinia sorghi]|uniref:Uncharacterized protein n=1 Tax=Puccinia sorghi TaxID=27349 RepID=A0A0L6VC76_9BASI|nr:hypothetical protein VP01_1981g11 [Puccinia sorghi]